MALFFAWQVTLHMRFSCAVHTLAQADEQLVIAGDDWQETEH
jgi:hypothetical protein